MSHIQDIYQVDFNHPVHVYFIGIGGISMSGLAEILLSEGFSVSGSDWNRSPLTERLEQQGAVIHYGRPQKAETLKAMWSWSSTPLRFMRIIPNFRETLRRKLPSLTRGTGFSDR